MRLPGLHLSDVEVLVGFERLVDGGRTVDVIEHHREVISQADWLIDMRPRAGHEGGTVVCSKARLSTRGLRHGPGAGASCCSAAGLINRAQSVRLVDARARHLS